MNNVTDASYNFMVGLDRWQFKVILFWLGSLKLLLERHYFELLNFDTSKTKKQHTKQKEKTG